MRKLFTLLTFLFIGLTLHADHILGGEMNYEYIGNNQYIIRLTVYRDCSFGSAPFDDPANVGVFNSGGVLLQSLTMDFNGEVDVTTNFTVPCGTAPTSTCIKKTTYVDTLTLPPLAGGYRITYQRCCRTPSIINIVNPDDEGVTYSAIIPGIANSQDSNPVITNLPPVYACAGLPLSLNFAATDKENDSLVYYLCVPFDGASSGTPAPTPAFFTSANPVIWATGYSLNNALNSNPPLAINSQTGQITGTPNALGQYVFSVCIDEYRNGVLIGKTTRDMQLTVVDCQITVIASSVIPQANPQGVVCSNTVAFQNNSTGASAYSWDFGVSGVIDDTSNLANPSYTYPGPGNYTATLIARDPNGATCNDTIDINVTIAPPFVLNAGPDAGFCTGSGIAIGPQGSATGLSNFSWSPATDLSDPTAQNPLASPTVTTIYVLTAENADGCPDSDSVTVFVGQFPTSVIDTALTASCDGWALNLFTTTLDTAIYDVKWMFTFDNSIALGPNVTKNFNFGDTTSAFVYLVDAAGGCSDTLFVSQLLPPVGQFFTLPLPNVFTPNGDGINDCFKPDIIPGFETCYTMVIYNRWGMKVFETTQANTCWNGKMKSDGADASDGIYFYTIDIDGKSYNGTVILLSGN